MTETTYQQRAAWQLEVSVEPNQLTEVFGTSADRLDITVDQETGIPVRIVECYRGRFIRELSVRRLAVNEPLQPGTFTIDFRGREVMRSDEGFRRMPLERVRPFVGYRPLVPAWVPAGFELAEVAAAKEALPTGSEGGNPPSRMVVSLAYRRGLDEFLVTTRLSVVLAEGEPVPRDPWSDPLATGEGVPGRAREGDGPRR